MSNMDILYYSNFCRHSKEILQYLAKNNLTHKVNFICLDNRNYNPTTNQTTILLDDGKKTTLPPNIDRVPALFLVSDKYRAIFGSQILSHFGGDKTNPQIINDEPVGVSLDFTSSRSNIVSEQYTSYGLVPEELSSKGISSNRPVMPHYVSVNSDLTIRSPPDTYKSDKISEKDFSMEDIQQRRNQEIGFKPPHIPI